MITQRQNIRERQYEMVGRLQKYDEMMNHILMRCPPLRRYVLINKTNPYPQHKDFYSPKTCKVIIDILKAQLSIYGEYIDILQPDTITSQYKRIEEYEIMYHEGMKEVEK